jgi:hypothetical protein
MLLMHFSLDSCVDGSRVDGSSIVKTPIEEEEDAFRKWKALMDQKYLVLHVKTFRTKYFVCKIETTKPMKSWYTRRSTSSTCRKSLETSRH